MGVTRATIKRLFAKSGNRCAFPKCRLSVVTANGTMNAEICHIKAKSKKGPRYDRDQNDEERDGERNLILLCTTHHNIIDTEIDRYPVEKLTKMKYDHEQRYTQYLPELLIEHQERINFDIPKGWTFAEVVVTFVRSIEGTVDLRDFTQDEQNLQLQDTKLQELTVNEALSRLQFLNRDVPPYRVQRNDKKHFRLLKT